MKRLILVHNHHFVIQILLKFWLYYFVRSKTSAFKLSTYKVNRIMEQKNLSYTSIACTIHSSIPDSISKKKLRVPLWLARWSTLFMIQLHLSKSAANPQVEHPINTTYKYKALDSYRYIIACTFPISVLKSNGKPLNPLSLWSLNKTSFFTPTINLLFPLRHTYYVSFSKNLALYIKSDTSTLLKNKMFHSDLNLFKNDDTFFWIILFLVSKIIFECWKVRSYYSRVNMNF